MEKEPTYHNISFTETFGALAYIIRHIAVFRRDIGAVTSPFNAYLTNLGIETLHLRMERHSSNALAIAKFLESHPKIESVSYPFLESSPTYENAKKYLKPSNEALGTPLVQGAITVKNCDLHGI